MFVSKKISLVGKGGCEIDWSILKYKRNQQWSWVVFLINYIYIYIYYIGYCLACLDIFGGYSWNFEDCIWIYYICFFFREYVWNIKVSLTTLEYVRISMNVCTYCLEDVSLCSYFSKLLLYLWNPMLFGHGGIGLTRLPNH